MPYGGYKYYDENYSPGDDDLLTLWWVESSEKLRTTAEGLAAESSVGTWTSIKTMNEEVIRKYRARIYRIVEITPYAGFVYIAYPMPHFDRKNLLQILASIRGNVYGLKELRSLRLMDIRFPKEIVEQFHGPKHGLEGIRKYLGTESDRRPHIGTIVKPKVGLSPEEFAEVAYRAYMGGVDFVKDDENLVDQEFCMWEERLYKMLEVMDRVREETGRKVLYASNITDRFNRMVQRADFLKDSGAPMAMIDVYMIGYSALTDIIEILRENGLIIHAHRAGHTAETRGSFGTDFRVFAKIWRILGVDQLHCGTGVGKMEGSPVLIRHYSQLLNSQSVKEDESILSLGQEWFGIKEVMPVASGGLYPGTVPALLKIFGNDVTIQAGGGIHGHPMGTEAGAKAMRQAVDAAMHGIPLQEYAEDKIELKNAIEKWGIISEEDIEKKLALYEKNREKFREGLKREGFRFYEMWFM